MTVRRVRGPTRSPTSSLVCSPPTPSPPRPSASCAAAPRKARGPARGRGAGAAGAGDLAGRRELFRVLRGCTSHRSVTTTVKSTAPDTPVLWPMMPLEGARSSPSTSRRATPARGASPNGRCQRPHARRASRPGRGWGPRDWPRSLALRPLSCRLHIRCGARVRKPTFPEQLYIDFDGFFRDRASVRGRPRQFRDIATGVNANKEAFSVTRRNSGTARRRGPTRRVSGAAGAGGTNPPAAPPGRTRRPAHRITLRLVRRGTA